MLRRLTLCAVLLASLLGCTSGQARPTPSMPATPSVAACDAPVARTIAPYFGPATGGTPVWAVGGPGPAPTSVTGAPGSPGVTYMKVLWVVEPGFAAPVELRGRNRSDGAPLWFGLGGETPTTAATLDPQRPGIPVQHDQWREWPSYLFVPTAGCYTLEASWPGGSWRMDFLAR